MGLFFNRHKKEETPAGEKKPKGLREDHELYYAQGGTKPICTYCYRTKHETYELDGPDFIGLYTCPNCGRQFQRRPDEPFAKEAKAEEKDVKRQR